MPKTKVQHQVVEQDGIYYMTETVDDSYWYYPDQRKSRSEYPYTFSPYFVFGDHSTIKGASADYSDRYALWDTEKLKAACEAADVNHPHAISDSKVAQKFITAYYGKGYKLVGIVQWCNASTGYPLKSFHFKNTNVKN